MTYSEPACKCLEPNINKGLGPQSLQACVSLVQPDAVDHVDWLVGGILEVDLDSGWELAPSTPDQVKRLLADVNHIVGRIRLMNEKPGGKNR